MLLYWRNTSTNLSRLNHYLYSLTLRSDTPPTIMTCVHFTSLPNDIHFHLVKYLPTRDIINMSQTCSTLRCFYASESWRKCYVTDHTESGDCLQPALAVDLFDQPLDSRAITADQLNEKKENKIGKYDWIISNVIHEIVLSDFSQLYPTLKSIDCPKFPALRRIRFAKS